MTGRQSLRQFIGTLVMALGLSIAALCGLCTGVFQVLFVLQVAFGNGQGAGMLALPLMVGAVPIAIGVGLIFLGRAIGRN